MSSHTETVSLHRQESYQNMVQAWIHIHHDELVADWNIAMTGEKVFRIDPLK